MKSPNAVLKYSRLLFSSKTVSIRKTILRVQDSSNQHEDKQSKRRSEHHASCITSCCNSKPPKPLDSLSGSPSGFAWEGSAVALSHKLAAHCGRGLWLRQRFWIRLHYRFTPCPVSVTAETVRSSKQLGSLVDQ